MLKPIPDAIKEAIGFGEPRLHVASSCALIVNFIFYLYIASSRISLDIYPFHNRVTYYTFFDSYIFSQSIDYLVLFSSSAAWFFLSLRGVKSRIVLAGVFGAAIAFQAAGIVGWPLDLIALASTPAIIALLIVDRNAGKILNFKLEVLGRYFGLTSLILATAGLVVALTFVAGSDDQSIRNYSYELFLIFYSLSPILILILVASVPAKVVIEFIKKFLKTKNEAEEVHESKIGKRTRFYYLCFFMILSAIMGIIPHLETVNKDGQIIGVDTGYYVNWVGALADAKTPQEFFDNAFVIQARGDRPVTLVFIYAVYKIVNSDLTLVVEHLPVILGPGLVLTVYWLTREMTRDERISLIASFITAISFHTLIGIYAGFYANWLALITGYLGILFLLRYLRERRERNLVVFFGLLFLTLFTHVYTWSVLAIVMGVYLSITLYRKRDERKAAVLLFMVLASSVAVDVMRITLTDSTGGIERDIEFAQNLTGPDQFTQRWNNLQYTSTTFVGGIFGNAVILGLGVYWMYKSKMQKTTTILLLAFFLVGIIPIVIGDWIVQTRILYNIPFQIPAAIALSWIKNKPKGNILFLSICIWLVFIAVRTVSNFYLVLPS